MLNTLDLLTLFFSGDPMSSLAISEKLKETAKTQKQTTSRFSAGQTTLYSRWLSCVLKPKQNNSLQTLRKQFSTC
jgi:hypothetical protein